MGDSISLADQLKKMFDPLGFDTSILPSIPLSEVEPTTGEDGTGVKAKISIGNCQGNFEVVGKKQEDNSWEFVALAYADFDPILDAGASLPLVGEKVKGLLDWTGIWLSITSAKPGDIKLTGKTDLKIPTGIFIGISGNILGKATDTQLPLKKYPAADPPKGDGGDQKKKDGSKQKKADSLRQAKAKVGRQKDETPTDDSTGSENPDGNIAVQKKVGPLVINSLALHFTNPILSCALDASLTIGPFEAVVKGLSMSVTIGTSLDFDPKFELDGLGFAFADPALRIGGMVERVLPPPENTKFEYDGELAAGFGNTGFAVLASYSAMTSGMPSFFIFSDLNIPMGGPPFFDITGFTGGFGFDRSLTMPSLDKINEFPLLLLPQPGIDAKASAQDIIEILDGKDHVAGQKAFAWVTPKPDDYWLAAGIQFTSFEIIEGQLLLAAQFGQDITFALLGLATLSLPKAVSADKAFAHIELQLGAVLDPGAGSFNAGGSLTDNSYLLAKSVHLTGGFAVAVWFGDNPNSGQFAFTIGGYHPAFKPPEGYPDASRIAFNWSVSSVVSVKGDAYFAITSSCMMTGGGREITYQSGIVKAWFTAQADFLVNWHPFSFLGQISVELGASVTVKGPFGIHATVKASIGASLSLWGPPYGGYLKVHVVIVTITVRFGSSQNSFSDQTRQPLAWSEFAHMLPPMSPQPGEICKLTASAGLSSLSGGNPSTWFVRAATFQFAIHSAIPLSTYSNEDISEGQLANQGDSIQIRPMGEAEVYSILSIRVFKTDSKTEVAYNDSKHPWQFNAITSNVVAALWGDPLADSKEKFTQTPSIPSNDVVNAKTGYAVSPPDPELAFSLLLINITKLQPELIDENANGHPQNPLQTKPSICHDYNAPSGNAPTLDDIHQSGLWADERGALHDTLLGYGLIAEGDYDSMTTLSGQVYSLFTDTPLEQS